jgi:hypothetical protein
MKLIAEYINTVVQGLQKSKAKLGFTLEDEKKKANRVILINKTPEVKKINQQVKMLCKKFPIKKSY